MPRIRLLLADDHTVLRAGLKMLLNAQSDMLVIGEASSGEEAVQKACALRPDVVLMDITMPGAGGLDATKQICHTLLNTKVLVLTMHDDESYLRQFMQAGAVGYVLKKAADTELIDAVRAVYRGDIFIYPSLTKALLTQYLGGPSSAKERAEEKELLTEREREVLKFVALGYTHHQIADHLCLSVKTVETYKARLMEKLGLRGRADLVRYALSHGWLEAE
ncbi:MAG: response regulator transcription factor [Armatimonadetes bacterium]|nr:response regulator transcription factor [Armatimonadota bacterium]